MLNPFPADLSSTGRQSHPRFRRLDGIHGVVHEGGAYALEGMHVVWPINAFSSILFGGRKEKNIRSFSFSEEVCPSEGISDGRFRE